MHEGATRWQRWIALPLSCALLSCALLSCALSCGRLVGDEFPSPSASPPSVTPLGPWREGESLRATFESLPRSGSSGTELRLMRENDMAWAERWRLLASARESVDLSSFILKDDVYGMALLGHLEVLAERGVRVRLSLDGQGTAMTRSTDGLAVLRELVASPNVEIHTYRPVAQRWAESLFAMQPAILVPTEHDKILVVDGRRSLMGGRNIAEEYVVARRVNPHAFEDADIRIDSEPVARTLTAAFETQYASDRAEAVTPADVSGAASGDGADRAGELRVAYEAMEAWLEGSSDLALDRLEDTEKARTWSDRLQRAVELRGINKRTRPPTFHAETRILDSPARFGVPMDPISEGLIRLVHAARRNVFIQSPYIVLPEKGVAPFADACQRGVEITVLTNGPTTSDNMTSQALFLEKWPALLAAAPCMRLFVANDTATLHAKVASFDGQVGVIGTYNLEPMSMFTSSEVVAAVWSREFADALMRRTRELIEMGPPVVYEYRIERDAAGAPLLDDDGKPKIAFGPRDHVDAAQLDKLALYRGFLDVVDQLHLVPSIF